MAEPGDLHTTFPDLNCENGSGYCVTDPAEAEANGRKFYDDWEREVARPAIEKAGYRSVAFYSIEEDSFGPLIRGVSAIGPDGKIRRWAYG